MKTSLGKRGISLLLSLLLCLSLLPMTALAGYDGTFDIYVFDYNTGTDTDLTYSLALDAEGTARFGISLDLDAAFPDDIVYVRMFESETDTWYTLYENGTLYYGASADEFATGFLSVVTIPDMVEGSYLVEAAVKGNGDYDKFYVSNPDMAITVGSGGSVPVQPVINTLGLPDGRVGESYSATLEGSNVLSWSAEGLPAGLSLSGNVISGTPTEAGNFTVSVTATNAAGSVSENLTLVVSAARTCTVNFILNGGVGADGATYTGLTYTAGQTLIWPAAPTRTGFTFLGWSCGGVFYPAGGDAPVVNGPMRFTAQWEGKPAVAVAAPGLEPVIGYVWLIGIRADGSSSWLWDRRFDEVGGLEGISISQSDLYQREFTRLELRAKVGGTAAVIAEFDGTVNGDTGAVALTPTGVSYAALKDLAVTGLTYRTDYYISYVRDSHGKEISFRSLVEKGETYQVKLFSNSSFPDRALYDWDAVYSVQVEGGMLTVTPRLLGEPSVTVTGTVTLNGTPVPGVRVAANQYFQGVSRTQTAVTDENGVYLLRVYPVSSTGIYLNVTSGTDQFQLNSGGYVAPPAAGTTEIRNDIVLSTALLHTEVSIVSASDHALVSRYLSALDSYYPRLSVSNGTNTDHYSVFLRSGSGTDTFRLFNTAAESGTLTCTLSAVGIENTTATAALSGAAAAVTLTPALKHGVLARLGAQVTGSYFFAWYNAAGAYVGRSERFSLSAARDVAAVCPEGVAPGSYAVILLPDVAYANVALTTLATLPLDQRVRTWNAAIPAQGVAELEPYTVDAVTSQNARFVTQPASTLVASADSFCDEMDLIVFTGSIGLDPGLTGGRLSALNIDTRASAEDNTAPIQAVIVNGKLYEPYVGWNVSMFGYYSVDLREDGRGIELPCEYTIYCKPGSIDWNMHFTMTAYGTYEGGITGQGAFSGDLVGSAVVSRPGSSIYALSTYVCSDSVQVSGTARRGEAVSIYDNGVLAGTVQGDPFSGRWTALVPLRNVDKSERRLATLHSLTAITASGVESEELTLIHQADGPELTSFKMRWNGREVNVGDAYAYSWGMTSPTFVAAFEHPEKLELMPEWGEDVRVVFKVYTTDGAVRFLPATGEGPEFSAAVDGTLHTSVTRAEALFSPAWPRDHYDEALGYYRMEVSSEEAEKDYDAFLSEYNEANGLTGEDALTREKVKEQLDGATSAESWKASYDGENITYTGAFAGASPDEEALAESLRILSDAGVTAFTLEQRCGDDALSTSEWMTKAGREADGTTETRTSGAVRMYRTADDLKSAETYAAGFARKWIESTDEHGNKTVIYVFTDSEFDDEGEIKRWTYDVTLQYYYGYAGMYSERISAAFFDGFTAWETEQSDTGSTQTQAALLRTAAKTERMAASKSGSVGSDGGASAKPSTEINVDATVQTLNEQSGNTGTVLALGDNALTIVGSKAAGPLGVVGGFFSWTAWWKQTGSWAESLAKYVNNDWSLLSVFTSPCFGKLTGEEKQAVIMRYLDVSIRNLGRETVDTFNWMQSTAVNLFNTGVQAVGLVGALPSAGGTALFAALLTTLTTTETWMIDRACTDTIKIYDADHMMSYEKARADIDSIIRAHANDTGDADCNGKNSKDGDGKSFKVSNDPSGVVYEGVIENPVEGAAVTLWYAVDAEGYPVREETAALAANLIPAAEVRDLIPQEHTQITDENGFYQWGVPEGLWFVTAEYAGLTGDSDGDSAAVVHALDRDLLPVLPPQLDVNIPLVDGSAPVVETVRYTTEGVYVTFSKYMNEAGTAASVLSKGSYSVYSVSDDTELVITGIESVEQGHAPANRDAAETTYTRTVLLRVDAPAEGTELRLSVAGTVESYAGTPMGEDFTGFGAVTAQEALASPVITPASGTVERGSEVVITGPEGAAICYTTDGSEPTRETARYLRPFAVTNDVTIRAIAIRPGYADSAVAEANYTVATGVLTVAVRVVADDGGDADGLTLRLGTYTAQVERGVARFPAVASGTYTLSFAGNGAYESASETVTVADGSVVLVLHLEPKPTDEPGPTPDTPVTPVTPATPDEPERPFVDVPEGAWYYDAVYACYDAALFRGVDETHFEPQGPMTRAMFATVLYRMAGEPAAPAENPFADVTAGAWYADAVLWAAEQGIIEGYGDGRFGTNDLVTREQMVALLWRFRGRPAAEAADLSGFTDDERISAWAKDAFAWAVSAGVIRGRGSGTLDPKGTATRAEVAQIVRNCGAKTGA